MRESYKGYIESEANKAINPARSFYQGLFTSLFSLQA